MCDDFQKKILNLFGQKLTFMIDWNIKEHAGTELSLSFKLYIFGPPELTFRENLKNIKSIAINEMDLHLKLVEDPIYS